MLRTWRRAWVVILLSCIPFLTGCGLSAFKDRILAAVVDWVPLSIEAELGEQLLPSLLPAKDRLSDPQAEKQLEALLAPLLAVSSLRELPIRIYISKDPQLNAFALPGGILVFNRGLLMTAENPEEILGVAAHELAHATERHVLRSMIQSLSVYALMSFFLGDVQGIGAILLQQGSLLLQNSFSRHQERQADAKGFDYLMAAGLDPRGMLSFFKRIQASQREEGRADSRKALSFFSTHPLTTERIETVESRWALLSEAERKRAKPRRFDLRALREALSRS